ncbi:hypothetical protein [Hyphomicrobium sp. 99]|uniref:hypothetical protein n=1 Tax=Hyphomicrobium sp. 99 TaxID=1163419 RepID=UPI0012E0C092|nr:hypothetical protein [Hyphomicrobium sp. 99]
MSRATYEANAPVRAPEFRRLAAVQKRRKPCDGKMVAAGPTPAQQFDFRPFGAGHRRAMQGWFSQIVIGVIVTVLGTVIANAVTGGRAGHHFVPSFHASSRH